MSSSGAIRAGKAFIELFTDGSKLSAGLKAAGATVAGWARSLTSQGTKLAGLSDQLTPLSEKSGAVADALDHVSGKFGGAASALSPLARGFAQVTGSSGKVVEGIKNSAVAMAALSGAATAAGYLPTVLAALISPAGLAAVAVAGLGYAFVNYTDTGKEAFGKLTESVVSLKDDAVETFGAISNALEAGDIAAAMEVLTTTLKAVWQTAVIFLEKKWRDFSKGATDLAYGVAEIASHAWGEMEKAWVDVTVAMQQAWSDFYRGFLKDSQVMKGVFEGVTGAIFGGLGGDVAKALETAGETGPDRAAAEREKKKIERRQLERGQEIRDQNKTATEGIDAKFNADLEERQKTLEEAKEKRRQALAHAQGLKPLTPAAAAAEQAAAAGVEKTRAVGAVGGEDVRSAEGFKAIANLFRGGNPQDKLVAQGDAQGRLQNRQFIEQRRTREAVEKITVKSFA